MKIFLTITLFFILSQNVYSQSNWFWQNPLPQGNNLYGLNVFDENSALCISSNNILKTNDGGENWNLINTGFPGINSCISMFDINSGLILIDSNNLIKTSNGGNNWFHFNELNNISYPISLTFINQNTGFLLSHTNVWRGTQLRRTSNGGLDWEIMIDDDSFELNHISFPDMITGYGAGSKNFGQNGYRLKLFKTTNSGITWDSLSLYEIGLDPTSLYFMDGSTGFMGSWNGILKTSNGGVNWIILNNSVNGIRQFQFLDSLNGFAVYSNSDLRKTTDGGVNWISTSNTNINNFHFINSNICYSVGYAGKLSKTLNAGNNWIRQDRNFTTDMLYGVTFSDKNTGFIVGENRRIFRTVNGGLNWTVTQFDLNLDWEVTVIGNGDSDIWYVTTYPNGKILKTTNTGLSWDTLYTGLDVITRLDFINSNTGFGVCKNSSFFKTTNGGNDWIIDHTFWPGQTWSLDFIDENTGYAGGNQTRKTTNGGLNWVAVDFGQYYYSSDIQFVNHNTGFVATNQNLDDEANSSTGIILKTTNAGLNWEPKVVGGGAVLDINFVNERIGFALTGLQFNGDDIFKTTDSGENWFRILASSSGYLTNIFFTDSLTGYSVGFNGKILKTTNGGGEPVGIEPITNEIPNSITLFQNYPNPFNPSTKIKFTILADVRRQRSNVRLVVYDLIGREVVKLVDEILEPGGYEAEFDGSDLSSGIYFYRLELDGTIFDTKKMMMIK